MSFSQDSPKISNYERQEGHIPGMITRKCPLRGHCLAPPGGPGGLKSQEVHYEKYYTGSQKSGKDYRLFVEKLEILRRK